ncbi:U-box domain protein [Catovirus CTV1]|uniref:U-box domain protein n=1 Tax=Catovirus CTV1 TaxID=1977631 RepID=A0A1V0SBH5_9VIRU|nr:U-box domain protein [Catovirus CTV1]
MESNVLSEIFDLNEFDEEDVKSSYDVLILNKILEENDKVNYLINCYKKSQKFDISYQDLSKSFFLTFITGKIDSDHIDIFDQWILKNKFDLWDFILTKDNYSEIYYRIIKLYNANDYDDVIYHNIKKIISDELFCDVLKITNYNNGNDEQKNGPLSWFNKIPFDPDMIMLTNIINTLSPNKLNHLLNRFYYIFDLNKSFSFSEFSRINANKNCSIDYIFMIFRLLLNLLLQNANNELKYTKDFPRNNFKLHTSDSLITKIFVLTCKAFNLCYNYQLMLFENYRYNEAKLQKKFNGIKNFGKNPSYAQSLVAKLEETNKVLNHLKNIFENPKYKKDIQSFIEFYIDKNIVVENNFLDYLILTFYKKIILLNDYEISDKIENYYLDLISKSDVNSCIRFNCMEIILQTIGAHGFRDKHNPILTNTLKYLSEVDFYSYVPPTSSHRHLISIMSNLSKLCVLVNKNSFSKNDYDIIHKGLHKISSKIMDFLEIINQIVQEINSKPSLLLKPLVLVQNYGNLINNTMIKINIMMSVVANMLELIIVDTDKLRIELIIPINTLVIQILKFYSLGSNPIYTVFGKNMEALDTMALSFLLINVIKENNLFKREIYEYLDLVKEVLQRVKLNEIIKNSLNNYFANFGKLDDYIDVKLLPEEFTDPILCTQIRDPIMIPHVDLIFDKSSILSQLYRENINPYTREPLTLDEIEKYNKLPNIVEKINEFNNKFQLWKKNNINN